MAADGSASRALLGRYELRQQVGSGGMGEVWLGWDRRLQRDVAVKLLLPQLSDEPTFRERFGVEARAAAALDHPNVVAVYDIDEDSGSLFLVMERLPGPSLDRRLIEGPVPEEEVRRIAADTLAGLEAAHRENLIHRDIKPGNLIRTAGGRWKVCDFGVAKDLASTAQLTLVGVAVGTPAYLAPEQLEGRPATPATDLWAAAVVLREALTGQRPFQGGDPIAVAHAVRHTQLVPLAQLRPDISPHLAGAVDRALAFDPTQRFASAADMAAAIEGRPMPVPTFAARAIAAAPPAGPPAAAEVGAAAGLSGPPPEPRRSRLVTVLWIVTAVGATILAALLVALLISAVVATEEDQEDQEPPPTTITDTPPESAPEADPPPASDLTPSTTRPLNGPSTVLPGPDPTTDQGGSSDSPPGDQGSGPPTGSSQTTPDREGGSIEDGRRGSGSSAG